MKKKSKKIVKKKIIKKVVKKITIKKKVIKKKVVKKKVVKKKAVRTKASNKRKPIGKVLHFYNKISVAIIKFNKPTKIGTNLSFEGNKNCFFQILKSMQYDHKSIKIAKKGQGVGVKVKKEVKEGDLVF
ncbi:hypothetical protein KJ671_03850 [Patescibacteria group bacterium]|nr:hypothetical protein [Patescibacteria group bacterium]